MTLLTSSLSHSYLNHLALLFIFLTNLVLLKVKMIRTITYLLGFKINITFFLLLIWQSLK